MQKKQEEAQKAQQAAMEAAGVKNKEDGAKFLAENAKKAGVKTTASGIQYEVLTEGKGDKPPSVKVSYVCGLASIREWLCPQHSGYAKSKADRWWHTHGGQRPFPASVMEWLERQRELKETAEISVHPDGKYWTVAGHKVGEAANDNTPNADNDNRWRELDDEIPF